MSLWLVVQITNTTRAKVQVSTAPPEPSVDPAITTRFSPIYPLVAESKLPTTARTYHIGFFILRRPAAGIAQLSVDQQAAVCIGLGLA